MTRTELRRAAYWLRLHATSLRASNERHGAPPLKAWYRADTPLERYSSTQESLDRLKVEYDEMMALSRALYAMARERAA